MSQQEMTSNVFKRRYNTSKTHLSEVKEMYLSMKGDKSSPTYMYEQRLLKYYQLSNETELIWKKSYTERKKIHMEWFSMEKKAHERSRQVLQTYRDQIHDYSSSLSNNNNNTMNNNILKNGSNYSTSSFSFDQKVLHEKIQMKTIEAMKEVNSWKKMLPILKRKIEEKQNSLSFLKKEALTVKKSLLANLQKNKVSIDKVTPNEIFTNQQKDQQNQQQNQNVGIEIALRFSLNEMKRGLKEGREELSDLTSQYSDAVVMYRALTKTTGDYQRDFRRSTMLKEEENSNGFVQSKYTNDIYLSRKVSMKLKEQTKHAETLLNTLIQRQRQEQSNPNCTASEKMQLALDRLNLSEKLEIVSRKWKKARVNVETLETMAKANGVKMVWSKKEDDAIVEGGAGAGNAETGSSGGEIERSATGTTNDDLVDDDVNEEEVMVDEDDVDVMQPQSAVAYL